MDVTKRLKRVSRACALAPLLLTLLALPVYARQGTRLIAEFGSKGTQSGQFSENTVFHADGFGSLYVSDSTYKRIQKLDMTGRVVLEISNSTLDGVTLLKPGSVVADAAGSIYVVDRDFVRIEDGVDFPAFYYALVVRKFASNGEYVATFNYMPLTEKQPWNEPVARAITPNGATSAIVQVGDLGRTVLLAVAPSGDLYVSDMDTIYVLDPDGEYVSHFPTTGGAAGQTYDATAMTVAPDGSIYLADTMHDRVVRFSSEGDFLGEFGVSGTRDGELREPFALAVQNDGTLLVGDKAIYTRVHATELPVRKQDPSPTLGQAALPPQYRYSSSRLYTTLIERVQRFTPEGEYLDKVLVRFPTDSPNGWQYELRAIGSDAQLYYQHTDTLTVRNYVPGDGVAWAAVHKTLHLSYDLTTLNQSLDNPDLDGALGTEADYRARGFLFQDKDLSFLVPNGAVGASAFGQLQFEYDWDERERFSMSGGYFVLRSRSEQLFQTEAGLDPARSFPMDDRDVNVFDSVEMQFTWERTLNQDPYRYRTMTTFANTSFGSSSNVNFPIADDNLRLMRSKNRFWDWEVGVEYDMSPDFYGTMSVLRGPAHGGFNGFWTFVDETGALFARGFNEGSETRVQLAFEGYL
jgi:hypothetical protein